MLRLLPGQSHAISAHSRMELYRSRAHDVFFDVTSSASPNGSEKRNVWPLVVMRDFLLTQPFGQLTAPPEVQAWLLEQQEARRGTRVV